MSIIPAYSYFFFDRVGGRQPKGTVGSRQANKDSSPASSKKPSPEVNKQQTKATGGDTIPLVFAKKSSGCGTGGTWVQPQIIKKSVWEGKTKYLAAVSQGNLAQTPTIADIYYRGGPLSGSPSTPSVTKFYKSNQDLTTNNLDCPITGDDYSCRADLKTIVLEVAAGGSRGFKSYDPPIGYYYQELISVHGSGDTTNTALELAGTGLQVIDQDTGDDMTDEWWDARPAEPETTTFARNVAGASEPTPCLPVGFVDDPFPDPMVLWEGWTDEVEGNVLTNRNGNRIFIYHQVYVNNQFDTDEDPTNGTLDYVRLEARVARVQDPSNPPVTDPVTNQPTNYSSFADTSFLEIVGDLESYESTISTDIQPKSEQITMFVEQGTTVTKWSEPKSGGSYTTGASNKFVDLVMFFFELLKRQDPAATTTLGQAVEESNIQDLAAFEDNYKLWFNGVIEQQVNAIDYVSTIAEFFLMSFVSRNGVYTLRPLLPLNASNQIDVTALTPSATFTDDDILPGSFAKQFIDNNERRDVNAGIAWNFTTCEEIGSESSTIVRYSTTAIDAPLIQFDMTDFCTHIDHAIIYGKYFLARRKHSTHQIAFQVPILTSELIPTQIIKVVRQRVTSRGDNRTETEWYQVTEVRHSTDGISTIQAAHFPVNASSIAKISDDVVNGSFTVA